ncbi:MAG: fatty acid desaturase [Chitinophagales bacterium]
MNQKNSFPEKHTDYQGVWIALAIIFLWTINLYTALKVEINYLSPLPYILFLLQIHLYTGLFITAHDAMHHSLAPQNRVLNDTLGRFCTFLYAFFPYQRLFEEHHEHHRYVHTDKDPDYYEGNFWSWYFEFVKHYVSIWQLLCYAISFNLLKLIIPVENLLIFWIAPAIISTFQLFYFGTYLPHKGEHDNKHYSRSQSKNHLWAFMTCYFFGYHYEHHEKPNVPWWKLWRIKEGE